MTIAEIIVRYERGMTPVGVTVINPRKDIGRGGDRTSYSPVLLTDLQGLGSILSDTSDHVEADSSAFKNTNIPNNS